MIKKISVLGSTGSIGTQTLEIARYNQDIGITALAAGSNVELLEKQVREFHPKIACLWKEEAARELRELGMRINAQNIRYGLRAGKFPFGVAINMGKQWEYLIYRKQFEAFKKSVSSK